ncbi:DIL domain-containing protein [Haematococcus lacustris]
MGMGMGAGGTQAGGPDPPSDVVAALLPSSWVPGEQPVAPRAGTSAFGAAAEAARLASRDATARFTLLGDEEEEEEGGEEGEEGAPPALGQGATLGGEAGGAAGLRVLSSAVLSNSTLGGTGGSTASDLADAGEEEEVEGAAAAAAAAGAAWSAAALAPWAELVAGLQGALRCLQEQHVPRILIKCLFKQLLAFVDAQLFNQLLLRPDCCCASNARHVLSGLRLLDQWLVVGAGDGLMRALYHELRHIRQAAQLLAAPCKARLSLEDLTGQLCPDLNPQQLYRLCTTYWEDPPAPGPRPPAAPHAAAAAAALAPPPDMVSGEVLEALKASGSGLQGNGGLIVTFLVDEQQDPIIAERGRTVVEVLRMLDTPQLYAPLALPSHLDSPDCPRAVFAFVEEGVLEQDRKQPS